MPMPSVNRYLLLDACLVAGYYLPVAARHKRAGQRIEPIIDSIKNGFAPNVFLYMPNLCIAEVFDVFTKFRYGYKWNKQVSKVLPKGLSKKEYSEIRNRFIGDIHNGHLLYQCELNRYHVLASDLISIVDNAYQHYRGKKRQVRPMGTKDHLIVGMGIHLARMHGYDNFAILTADHRMADLVERASNLKKSKANKLGLIDLMQFNGLMFEKGIFPKVFNLASCKNSELQEFFGEWPLPTEINRHPLKGWSDEALSVLVQIIQENGTKRDRLPSSLAMERIRLRFYQMTGLKYDSNFLWRKYANWEKAGKKSLS